MLSLVDVIVRVMLVCAVLAFCGFFVLMLAIAFDREEYEP